MQNLSSQQALPLWVVTSYYNPEGYRRREINFHAFRRNLKVPLLVIELAEEGRHQITDGDGDIVIRLTGDSHIWQKERLLNIGIASLPPHVKYVAWIDCDVSFSRKDWADETITVLESKGGIVQLFETVVHCPKCFDPISEHENVVLENPSLYREVSGASIASRGNYKLPKKIFARDDAVKQGQTTESPGHAWAARIEDLREIGIYDSNIVGGGDSVFFYGATGTLNASVEGGIYSPFHARHMLAWRDRAQHFGLFRNIGFLHGVLIHYWHGDFADRKYSKRHQILLKANYNPEHDVRLSSNQTWQWVSPAGGLARQVHNYFKTRKEDGQQ